jgi:hypothetical protein
MSRVPLPTQQPVNRPQVGAEAQHWSLLVHGANNSRHTMQSTSQSQPVSQVDDVSHEQQSRSQSQPVSQVEDVSHVQQSRSQSQPVSQALDILQVHWTAVGWQA